MPKFTLNLGVTEATDLINFLKEGTGQQHAWIRAKHTTDAERREAQRLLVTLQLAIDQLERA